MEFRGAKLEYDHCELLRGQSHVIKVTQMSNTAGNQVLPNGEHKLFVTRPRQGEKNYNELLQSLFFYYRIVVPDERRLCYPTRNVYLFRSVKQLVKQNLMCCLCPNNFFYPRSRNKGKVFEYCITPIFRVEEIFAIYSQIWMLGEIFLPRK